MLARLASLSLLFVGCAHAPVSASVAGTQWHFLSTTRVVTFLADGTTRFSDLATSGHWTQDGDHLVFDSNGFTEFRVVIDGDRMRGQWKRLEGPAVGLSSETSLERQR